MIGREIQLVWVGCWEGVGKIGNRSERDSIDFAANPNDKKR
jgi:hypothetical protein